MLTSARFVVSFTISIMHINALWSSLTAKALITEYSPAGTHLNSVFLYTSKKALRLAWV